MSRTSACLGPALLLALALAAGAAAQSRSGWAYDLADQIMSPFCPGRALSECPSSQAGDLRRWILEQEEAGRSREDVEAELYRTWGDQLRQTPKAEGMGLVAYTIPAFVFAAGGALVFFFLHRQRGAASTQPPVVLPDDDPELERAIEEELGQG